MNPYRRVRVSSATGAYSVHLGGGVSRLLAEEVKKVAPSCRCALITDETVGLLWGSQVADSLAGSGIGATVLTVPTGEAHKTRESWAMLTDSALKVGLGRDACIVSLGGGVVGDLAGFVAATYMRGVPIIHLPTTTLAIIDASVGGKTGVDHSEGKNLIGAFHPPAAVLADPDFLETLNIARRAEGFAEAVKHGVILDVDYAVWLAQNAKQLLATEPETFTHAVARSVEMKAGIVREDEFEAGRRQILNYGHTVGHALEAASGYTLPHGHAVATGMVLEAHIGEKLGVTKAGTAQQIAQMVDAFGLPTKYKPAASCEAIVKLMSYDKKARAGTVHIVLLEETGRVTATEGGAVPVAASDIARILEEVI